MPCGGRSASVSTAVLLFFSWGERRTVVVTGPVGGVDGRHPRCSWGAAGCGCRVGTERGRVRSSVDGAGRGGGCPRCAHELSTDGRSSVHRSESVHPQSCPQMWVNQWSSRDAVRPDAEPDRDPSSDANSQGSLAPHGRARSVTPFDYTAPILGLSVLLSVSSDRPTVDRACRRGLPSS